MSDDLYARAVAKAKEYRGDAAGLGEGPLARLAPNVDKLKDELLWGVLWSDPSIDLKTRSLCTISALIVLGMADQLRNHMRWALNIGVTKEQLVSICSQMLLYGGLAATHNAMRVASEVLKEKGLD